MAAASGKSSVPSGWYPDPNNSAINRWWSGSEWTRDVSPRDAAAEVAADAATKVGTRAAALAAEARSATDAFENPVAARATIGTTRTPVKNTAPAANSAASYAASSARPSTPAAPFRAPVRSRPAPEIMQPPYAFNRTMSTVALIGVIIGLGLIAALLLG